MLVQFELYKFEKGFSNDSEKFFEKNCRDFFLSWLVTFHGVLDFEAIYVRLFCLEPTVILST